MDEEEDADRWFHLRPVTASDFTQAIKKLKASVDDNGKELMKVSGGQSESDVKVKITVKVKGGAKGYMKG